MSAIGSEPVASVFVGGQSKICAQARLIRDYGLAPATGCGQVVEGALAAPATGSGWWQPAPGMSWQWQLTGTLDLSVGAEVYDVDFEMTSAAQVAALHAQGRKAVCYVDVGAVELSRPDAASFPAAVRGAVVDGWPDERWLDIRQLSVLEPLMARRFQLCRDKGFDAVEADQDDAFAENSGFPLTAADQLAYNRMLAELAHSRGMAIGLKNDLAQIPQLLGEFDFAINEECAQYAECGALSAFIHAGKAVFHAEYTLPASRFCPITRPLGLSSIKKNLGLDAYRETCG
ncbi:endo alpha-1,4 polygalactosaminidase [Pseudonocardiaceae bacterium YIM PH 21723]|nr:endo alpha-1,4 polygalactosaminidase [Pseudonocardiaceae bacterium YIM PH 21723]